MADRPTKRDTSKPARSAIAKMSAEESAEINKAIRKAIGDRDLPKFKVGLAKLGYDETSEEYAQLLRLWDDYWSASRHD